MTRAHKTARITLAEYQAKKSFYVSALKNWTRLIISENDRVIADMCKAKFTDTEIEQINAEIQKETGLRLRRVYTEYDRSRKISKNIETYGGIE